MMTITRTALLSILAVAPGTLAVTSSKSAVESKTIEAAQFTTQSKTQFLEPIPILNLAIDKEAKEEEAKTEAKRAAALKSQIHEEKELVKLWFTWGFWRLLAACSACLLVFSEVLFPLAFMCFGRSLTVAAVMFLVQNLSFLGTAIYYVTVKSAGAKLCLLLSVVMSAMALLLLLGCISMQFQKSTPSIEILKVDLTYVFRPLSMFVIVFLIVQGLLDSSSSDWGQLALFASMLTLGVAFAVSGIVADMCSYCFIRANNYFEEGEFIMNDGDLLQVKHIFWCFTYAYRPKTRSDVFVPNSDLAGQGINNRSRDDARAFSIDLEVPTGSTNAQTTKMIQDVLALIKESDKSGFTAMNGRKFDGQIDVAKSTVFITGINPEGGSCTLKIKLAGKYYFSKPPQWKMDSPAPDAHARQMEWQAGWNYQMEWLLLEAKKIIDANAKK